jgi:DNA polymerase I
VVGAHLSNDEALIAYINAGLDMHQEIAGVGLGIPTNQVTKVQRQFGKNMDFAVMYDSSIKGLLHNFSVDFPFLTYELAEYVINYARQKFPDLYMNALKFKNDAMHKGYVQTMFGRKRRFPYIDKENYNDVMKQATNTPIQGTASDVCLLSGIRIDNELEKDGIISHLVIHDGILMSGPKGYNTKKIVNIMTDVPFESKVNFGVDIKISQRWGEKE